ncbi:MAG: hypothetical protein H6807_17130 [Planctomycetes bacterium]|nr:hypothetical protein [Planctomycetota bacterium]
MSRLVTGFLGIALVGAILGLRLEAQLPDWSSNPASSSSTVKLEESLAYVIDGNRVNAYSAITHGWTAVFTTMTPTVTLANESFIVKDGALFWGYSPHTGAFAPVYTFSATANVVPNVSPQTWHQVVVDGYDVHVFFALSGHWQTYSFSAPPALTIGRFCLLIDDGSDIYAISSYNESLRRLGVPGATVTGADGNVGHAYASGILCCFSAAKNAWAKIGVANQPMITTGNTQNGFIAINDGVAISFFSGHTGSFVTLPAAPTATPYLQRQVAIVVDGNTVYGYSGLKGSYSTMVAGSAPNVMLDQYHAVIEDPGFGYVAYSGVVGAFSAPLVGSYQIGTQAWLATATPAGWTTPSDFYSALTNSWLLAPTSVGMNAATWVTALSVVIEDPAGGLWGWSARGSSWVFEAFPGTPTVTVGTNPPKTAGTILAQSGSMVTTFNPRTESWRQTTIAGAPSYVRGHTSVILVVDGGFAHAFSNLTDAWSATPISATGVLGQGAQVHSGFVFDGSQVHAYSGLGQIASWGEFPDHWRNVTQGQRFGIDLAAEPGADCYLLFSLVPANVPTPWGPLLVDPATAIQAAHFLMPPAGVVTFTFQVPYLPFGVVGVPVYWQGVAINGMSAYLTNSATSIIL